MFSARFIRALPRYIQQLFQKFLWFCAGVDIRLLRDCETDHAKYTAIGTSVLLTAILAFLASAYIISSAIANPLYVLFLSSLWGWLVLNLNRFIVLSMRLDVSWGRNFLIAFPRFIIALIISVVVMTPLELRIFSPEIKQRIMLNKDAEYDKNILKMKQRSEELVSQQNAFIAEQISPIKTELDDVRNQLKTARTNMLALHAGKDPRSISYSKEIERLETERAELKKEKHEYLEQLSKVKREMTAEKHGDNGRVPGEGPRWKELDKHKTEIESDLKFLQKQLDETNALINKQRNDKAKLLRNVKDRVVQFEKQESRLKSKIQDILSDNAQTDERPTLQPPQPDVHTYSFLSEVTALHALADDNKTVDWIVLMLQLLMFLVEVLPIIAKLMSPIGAYEQCFKIKTDSLVSKYQEEPI